MSRCPVLDACRFFNDIIENVPAFSASLKSEYCLGDHARCARFAIFTAIGREHLPDDVFPHEMEKALRVVRHFRTYGEAR